MGIFNENDRENGPKGAFRSRFSILGQAPRDRRRPVIDHIAIIAGTLALTLLLAGSDWLQRWDNLIYDTQLHLMPRPAAEDIVIVAIDDASLKALGRWPWPREIHAGLVDRLTQAGARAVFLDILFSEETPGEPAQDQRLVQAVRENGRVFLPVIAEERSLGGQLVESLPFGDLAAAARGLGHVHLELEADGIARGVYLKEGLGTPYWEHITLALLRWLEPSLVESPPGLRNPASVHQSPFHVVRDHYTLIPFSGPPGHVPRLSYAQVLKGLFRVEDIRDSIIMVGATATGLGDVLPTPLSARRQPMSGVEINAQLLDGLRRGLTLTRMDLGWHLLLSALLVVIPFLLYPRLSPRAVLAVTLALLLGTLLLSALLLVLQQLWFPPVPALVGIMLSYPLWSWRRLENTMGYLNSELERLQSEPRLVEYIGRSPDLNQSIEFLSRILPIDGWQVEGPGGVLISRAGSAPQPLVSPPSSALWIRQGSALWAQVVGDDSSILLGLQWGDKCDPTKKQWAMLESFLSQLRAPSVPRVAGARNTRELIESRIHQVQSASDQLRNIRRLINDTLGQMDEGLVVTSTMGLVIMANPRVALFLTGEKGDLRGRPLLPLLDQLQIHIDGGWRAVLREVLIEGASLQLEANNPFGGTLYVQMAPLVLHDQAGRGMIINISDVTQLKRSERQRSLALGFLSHDLRSPITSLLALLESGGDEVDGERLEKIETYARKTLNLAEDFLQLARAENADIGGFGEIDLISVAHNAADELYSLARQKGIVIERRFEEEAVWLLADASLLERAFINLLGNAVKFTPRDSRILFRIERNGEGFQCAVIDQGPGISAEEGMHIFEPYTQADRSPVKNRQGAGLGLAQVKVVAEKHGGRIAVQVAPGGGAWFTLSLPLALLVEDPLPS